VAVGAGERGDEGGQRLRQEMRVGGVVGHQHLGHAGDFGGGFGHRADVFAGDQRVHLAQFGGGGDRGARRLFHGRGIMVEEDERGHG